MVNNNPGNIRLIKNVDGSLPAAFTGEVRPGDIKPGKRFGFRKFESIDKGTKALYKLLNNGYLRRGLNSIDKIIPVYAPVSDFNLPTKYIRDLANDTGIGASKILNQNDLVPLVKAITRIEKGESLPQGTAEKIFTELKTENFFSKNPLGYSAPAVIETGSGVFSFWSDKKKRTEVLTVGGIVVGGALLYRYAKKRKRNSRRA